MPELEWWKGAPGSPQGKSILATQLYNEAHRNSDRDQGDDSIHHTLGDGPFQAARGSRLKSLEETVAELDSAAASLGTFEDFVPTISGWTYSAGSFRYTRIGDLVTVRFAATIASVTGQMRITVPEAYGGITGEQALGKVHRLGGGRFGASVVYIGGNLVVFCDEIGNIWAVGNPAAWAVGHTVGGTFTYEAA